VPAKTTAFRVTASSLNVREGPSINAKAIAWFHKGDLIQGLETSADEGWVKATNGWVTGWCSRKYLEPARPGRRTPLPWMKIAERELKKGVEELARSEHNERILEYLRSTDVDKALAKKDETPWCSAFANWCVEKAGYEGTNSAWARSWLSWGKPVEGDPPRGNIVVLTRGETKGHVGFLDKVEKDPQGVPTVFHLLGGNQGNRVKISGYPAKQLLGIRVPGR
jgi:uncharacterized protein (TIGR02594 family)